MIFWLASYPKSGNTLLRSILATYFFSKDGKFKFKHLYKIGQFPNTDHFLRLGINPADEKKIFENYINAQKEIIKEDEKLKFLKTHSALASINGNEFTDLKKTMGAIYVVRDPRNVVTSFAYHMSLDIDQAVDIIINPKQFMPKTDKVPRFFLSSWGLNFNTWKKLNDKIFFIKYEDLINKKKTTLIKVFKFLKKLKIYNSELDMVKMNKIIKTTEFNEMQKLEKVETFTESMVDIKSGTRKPFFRLGPKNNWKKDLSSKNCVKIEKAFEKEMLELGYL